MESEFEYDIALSFAGEDREYVEKVAEHLKDKGIYVFYDMYEQEHLWGKDLYIHLNDVYKNKARYCMMFISKHYKNKLWTNHEMKSAFSRAFESNSEYILPVRFDDTEIPGIRNTTGFISLKSISPDELAELAIKKVHGNLDGTKAYLCPIDADGNIKGEIEIIDFEFANQTFLIRQGNRFTSKQVSLKHAIISLIGRKYYLADLNSLNGTKVNHIPISVEPVLITDGDILSFADMDFIFRIKR